MSSAQNSPFRLYHGDMTVADPGSGGTIKVDRSPQYVPLVSAAAEARTLGRPQKVGTILVLVMKTDGGNITLTVTGGYNLAGLTTYTFSDAGQMAVFVSAYDGTNYYWRLLNNAAQQVPAEILITTRTIRADESGKTFYLDLAAGFITTLPAVALGLNYKFIVKTAPTGSHTIVCPGGAALFKGQVLTVDVNSATDPDFDTTAVATLTLVLNKSVAGDKIEVECDGTNWHYVASCSVFDAITGT